MAGARGGAFGGRSKARELARAVEDALDGDPEDGVRAPPRGGGGAAREAHAAATPPLHAAARRGDAEGVRAALRGDADADATWHGRTALEVACERDHAAVASVLLQAGADATRLGGSPGPPGGSVRAFFAGVSRAARAVSKTYDATTPGTHGTALRAPPLAVARASLADAALLPSLLPLPPVPEAAASQGSHTESARDAILNALKNAGVRDARRAMNAATASFSLSFAVGPTSVLASLRIRTRASSAANAWGAWRELRFVAADAHDVGFRSLVALPAEYVSTHESSENTSNDDNDGGEEDDGNGGDDLHAPAFGDSAWAHRTPMRTRSPPRRAYFAQGQMRTMPSATVLGFGSLPEDSPAASEDEHGDAPLPLARVELTVVGVPRTAPNAALGIQWELRVDETFGGLASCAYAPRSEMFGGHVSLPATTPGDGADGGPTSVLAIISCPGIPPQALADVLHASHALKASDDIAAAPAGPTWTDEAVNAHRHVRLSRFRRVCRAVVDGMHRTAARTPHAPVVGKAVALAGSHCDAAHLLYGSIAAPPRNAEAKSPSSGRRSRSASRGEVRDLWDAFSGVHMGGSPQTRRLRAFELGESDSDGDGDLYVSRSFAPLLQSARPWLALASLRLDAWAASSGGAASLAGALVQLKRASNGDVGEGGTAAQALDAALTAWRALPRLRDGIASAPLESTWRTAFLVEFRRQLGEQLRGAGALLVYGCPPPVDEAHRSEHTFSGMEDVEERLRDALDDVHAAWRMFVPRSVASSDSSTPRGVGLHVDGDLLVIFVRGYAPASVSAHAQWTNAVRHLSGDGRADDGAENSDDSEQSPSALACSMFPWRRSASPAANRLGELASAFVERACEVYDNVPLKCVVVDGVMDGLATAAAESPEYYHRALQDLEREAQRRDDETEVGGAMRMDWDAVMRRIQGEAIPASAAPEGESSEDEAPRADWDSFVERLGGKDVSGTSTAAASKKSQGGDSSSTWGGFFDAIYDVGAGKGVVRGGGDGAGTRADDGWDSFASALRGALPRAEPSRKAEADDAWSAFASRWLETGTIPQQALVSLASEPDLWNLFSHRLRAVEQAPSRSRHLRHGSSDLALGWQDFTRAIGVGEADDDEEEERLVHRSHRSPMSPGMARGRTPRSIFAAAALREELAIERRRRAGEAAALALEQEKIDASRSAPRPGLHLFEALTAVTLGADWNAWRDRGIVGPGGEASVLRDLRRAGQVPTQGLARLARHPDLWDAFAHKLTSTIAETKEETPSADGASARAPRTVAGDPPDPCARNPEARARFESMARRGVRLVVACGEAAGRNHKPCGEAAHERQGGLTFAVAPSCGADSDARAGHLRLVANGAPSRSSRPPARRGGARLRLDFVGVDGGLVASVDV